MRRESRWAALESDILREKTVQVSGADRAEHAAVFSKEAVSRV